MLQKVVPNGNEGGSNGEKGSRGSIEEDKSVTSGDSNSDSDGTSEEEDDDYDEDDDDDDDSSSNGNSNSSDDGNSETKKKDKKRMRKSKRRKARRKQLKKKKTVDENDQKEEGHDDDETLAASEGTQDLDGMEDEDEDDDEDEDEEEWGQRRNLFKDTLEKGRFWYMKGRPAKIGHHRRLCWCILDKEAYQVRCYSMKMKVVSCIDLRLAKEPERCEPAKKGHYPVVFSSEHTRKAFTLEAETEEQRDMLYEKAQEVVRGMDPPDQEMIRMFLEADRDGSFTLDFNEVKRLLTRRGVQISVSAMHDKFDDVDSDRNGTLDFGEFERLENNIRYDKDIEKIFKRYAGRDCRYMSRAAFVRFLRVAQGCEVLDDKRLDAIIAKYNPFLREARAAQAAQAAQGKGAKKKKRPNSTRKSVAPSGDVLAVSAAISTAGADEDEDEEEAARRNGLDIRGFAAFLRSTEDNPTLRTEAPSLGCPLAQYMISACANPCMDGSNASTPQKTLEAAVAANCRYYELSALGKGDSVAFGVKGAKSISVPETLIRLKELLRRDPSMPLVVSLDVVGCSKAEQDMLRSSVEEAFGGNLASPDVLTPSGASTAAGSGGGGGEPSSKAGKDGSKLATPASLAGKVILMMRGNALAAGKAEAEAEAEAVAEESLAEGFDIASLARGTGGSGAGSAGGLLGDRLYSQLLQQGNGGGGGDDDDDGKKKKKKKKKKERYLVPPDDPADEWGEDDSPIVPGLGAHAALVGTTFLGVEKSKHPEFRNATSAGGRGPAAARSVITLKPAKALLVGTPTNAALLRSYCARRLARVLPRTVAENPFPLIAGGLQIAPADYTARKSGIPRTTLITREFFRGRGVVPKPAWLNTAHGVPPVADAVLLQVTIINARQLPKAGREAAVDPYVTATILGFDKESSPCANPYVPKSEAFASEATNITGIPLHVLAARVNKPQQTPTVKNNGWDPSWNTTFEFTLYAPALDALVLTIKDKDFGPDDFLGFAALPCNLINRGYRTLKLCDSFGNELPFAYLLCYFNFIPISARVKTTVPILPEHRIAVPTYNQSSLPQQLSTPRQQQQQQQQKILSNEPQGSLSQQNQQQQQQPQSQQQSQPQAKSQSQVKEQKQKAESKQKSETKRKSTSKVKKPKTK